MDLFALGLNRLLELKRLMGITPTQRAGEQGIFMLAGVSTKKLRLEQRAFSEMDDIKVAIDALQFVILLSLLLLGHAGKRKRYGFHALLLCHP